MHHKNRCYFFWLQGCISIFQKSNILDINVFVPNSRFSQNFWGGSDGFLRRFRGGVPLSAGLSLQGLLLLGPGRGGSCGMIPSSRWNQRKTWIVLDGEFFVDIHGYPLIYLYWYVLNIYILISIDIYWYRLISIDIYWYRLISIDVNRIRPVFLWVPWWPGLSERGFSARLLSGASPKRLRWCRPEGEQKRWSIKMKWLFWWSIWWYL